MSEHEEKLLIMVFGFIISITAIMIITYINLITLNRAIDPLGILFIAIFAFFAIISLFQTITTLNERS